MSDRTNLFLREMGLGPRWMLRDAGAEVPTIGLAEGLISAEAVALIDDPVTITAVEIVEIVQTVTAIEVVEAMAASAEGEHEGAVDATHQPSAQQIADMSWPQLQASVTACRRCARGEVRHHAISGAGDLNANWLYVSAVPDNDESPDAAPLAGASLALFGNMLRAIDLVPGSNVYLTTLVKCRAIDDRAPNADEINACRPYLERQIALLQPSILLAFGSAAAAALLQRDPATPLVNMRGPLQQRGGVPVVATHHPQHLIEHPADKREAWADLCLARETDAAST